MESGAMLGPAGRCAMVARHGKPINSAKEKVVTGQWLQKVATGCVLAAIIGSSLGCSSLEDRIENVVHHELEECKATDDLFHTVRTRTGGSFEILAELCHLEPSEVEMTNEWRGTIRTGPLIWMAEEDQEERAVMLRRVAWDTLDRALSHAGRENPSTEDFEEAERLFAQAQEQYGDSAWVRLERLDNLLRWRGDEMSTDDEESLVGEAAESYLEELIQWAQAAEDAETIAAARLAVVDHVEGYVSAQQRSIDTLGARDDRIAAAADHAEEEGDMEAAQEYRRELEERQEARPEVRAQLEERIELARREACGYVDAMHVDGVTDDALRQRTSSTMRNFDCDFSAEENEDDENGEE